MAELKTDALMLLPRMKVWQMWLLSAILAILLTEIIVAIMGLLQKGEVPPDYLFTGLVASGLVSSLMVFMWNYFLGKLTESEGRFRALIEHAPEAIVVFDVEQNRMVEANANAERLFECDRSELLKKSPQDFYPPGQPDRSAVAQSFREHNDLSLRGADLVFERLVRSAGGREILCEVRLVRLPAANRKLIRGSFIDITERKRAEKQMRMMEFALDQVDDAIYFIDVRNMQFIYANDGACHALGYTREELLAMTVFDIDPDTERGDRSTLGRSKEIVGSMVFERRHKTKEGAVFPVEILTADLDYEGLRIGIALARNITARKRQAEQEATRLRIFERLAQGGELEEILGLVVRYVEQVSPDFLASIMLADAGGKHLLLASAPSLPRDYTAKLGGIPIGEGCGSCGTAAWRGEAVIAEDLRTHPCWASCKQPALQAGLLSCWSEPIFDSSGKVIGTFGLYRCRPGAPSRSDLDLIRRASHLAAIAIERRRMEEALFASAQEFRSLAENSPDCIMRYDIGCRRVYVNPTFERETEIPVAAAISATPDVTPLARWRGDIPVEEYMDRLRRVMETGEPTDMVLTWTRSDGTTANHALRIVAEFAPGGQVKGCLAIGRNITSLMEAERRLEDSRAQLRGLTAKNEAVREEDRKYIAREVHDELGQILTGLQMDISMLSSRFGPALPALREHLLGTLELVNKSLAVARNVASSLRPSALDMGIVSAIEWLSGRFGKNTGIGCAVHVRDGDHDIHLSENASIALFRIAQESLTNVARHAQASKVDIGIGREGGSYFLEVRDDGNGFDSANMKKDTFGLVGIRERVLLLGGELSISSIPGNGTTIKVCIPAHNISVEE
jgi:PAS domain S-box-containing protein